MNQLKRIHGWLLPITDELVDRAMVAAMPTADAGSLRQIVRSLIQRGQGAGMLGLVRHYHELPGELRRKVEETVDKADGALREASGSTDETIRKNVVEIITRTQAIHLSWLLSDLLHSGNPAITRPAAAGLMGLAETLDAEFPPESAAISNSRRAGMAQRRGWLDAALTEAARCYHQHQRADVLAAVVALGPNRSAELSAAISAPRGAACVELSGLLRRAGRPAIRRQLLYFAAMEAFTEPVVESLRAMSGREELMEVAEASHLLLDPRVRSVVNRAASKHKLAAPARLGERLTGHTALSLARWSTLCGLEGKDLAETLVNLSITDEPLARLVCLRGLLREKSEESSQALGVMCFDVESAIAKLALRGLIHRRWTGLGKLTARLMSSPHHEVRKMAEGYLLPGGFNKFWEAWPRLDAAQQQQAGRALRKADRNFHAHLAERMAAASGEERLQAVMMARTLKQESYFETELLKLVGDEDVKVASAAVKALAGVKPSADSSKAIIHAMSHKDDRVRSNAVEAVEAGNLLFEARQELVRLAVSGGNRSRATAIKALMKLPIGGVLPALKAMMEDSNPQHRVSALWVINDLGLLTVIDQVVEMAKQDEDKSVRKQALSVVRKLAGADKGAGGPGRTRSA